MLPALPRDLSVGMEHERVQALKRAYWAVELLTDTPVLPRYVYWVIRQSPVEQLLPDYPIREVRTEPTDLVEVDTERGRVTYTNHQQEAHVWGRLGMFARETPAVMRTLVILMAEYQIAPEVVDLQQLKDFLEVCRHRRRRINGQTAQS